jgi:hypothetical protein
MNSLHAYLVTKVTPAIPIDDLLRAEWVGRVSALDLYVHELVSQNMTAIFEGSRPLCPGFSKFQCSSETVLRIRNAASILDAVAAFDLEVRTKLSRVTFQAPEEIADGFRLISDKELWNEIAIARGAAAAKKTATAKSLKKDLSLIIERRNKIVHEGDLQQSIPRTQWPISPADVIYVATFIEDLVRDLELLA